MMAYKFIIIIEEDNIGAKGLEDTNEDWYQSLSTIGGRAHVEVE